jgi:6-phosphogluconolactonase (cycloisomerase 2 family)
VLSNDDDFVYTANEGNGTVSAWSIGTSGALTAVSGAPFTGPTSVSALGVDKSGSYLVAAGYSASSGVQLFSIGTTGALTAAASAGTGTSTTYPVVLAMSH